MFYKYSYKLKYSICSDTIYGLNVWFIWKFLSCYGLFYVFILILIVGIIIVFFLVNVYQQDSKICCYP